MSVNRSLFKLFLKSWTSQGCLNEIAGRNVMTRSSNVRLAIRTNTHRFLPKASYRSLTTDAVNINDATNKSKNLQHNHFVLVANNDPSAKDDLNHSLDTFSISYLTDRLLAIGELVSDNSKNSTSMANIARNELKKIVARSVENIDLRKSILEVFGHLYNGIFSFDQRNNLEFLLQIYYNSVMAAMIVEESPHIIDVHLEMVRLGVTLTVEDFLTFFSLGSLSSESYLPVMLELYSVCPKSIKNGLIEKLLIKWIEIKAPAENVLPFIYESIRFRPFASDPKSIKLIERFLNNATIVTNEANEEFVNGFLDYLTRNGPNNVPEAFFTLVIRRSSIKRKKSSFNHNNDGFENMVPCRIYNICEPYLTKKSARADRKLAKKKIQAGYFWGAVIDAYHDIPIATIEHFMTTKNISITSPGVNRSVVKRQTTVKDCETVVRRLSKKGYISKDDHDLFACQILRLISIEQKNNPELIEEKYTLLNRQRINRRWGRCYKVLPEFIHSIMYGYMEVGAYSEVVNVFKSNPVVHDNIAWNLYASALSRSGKVDLAWDALKRMNSYPDVTIRPETVVSFVFGLICYGRELTELNDKSRKIRFSMKEIISRINMLDEWGATFPIQYCENFFSELSSVSVTCNELEQILFAIADLYTKRSSNAIFTKSTADVITTSTGYKPILETPSSRKQNEFKALVLDDILNGLDKKRRPTRIFTDEAITQVIYWGFFKNPSEPWRAIQILRKLSNKGIIIPRTPVMDTLSDIIAKVYGKLPIEGVYKRIRQQVDPAISVDDLIRNCNSAWKGEHLMK